MRPRARSGQKLTELLGQPVVVDNRPGAAGTVGADHVAKSAPDGYTLLVGGRGPISAAPLMNRNLSYVPSRDLTPVSNLVNWPYILVAHPSLPARNAKELIALAKAHDPASSTWRPAAPASGQHISGELFNITAGTRMTHVPYKGTAPAITDLMGGHAHVGISRPGGDCADQIRPAQGARRNERHTLRAAAAGAADQRVGTARLRLDHVVRADGAGGDAEERGRALEQRARAACSRSAT